MGTKIDPKVNYEKAKTNFLILVDHWLNNENEFNQRILKLHSKDNINRLINGIDMNSKYDVIEKDGKRILVLRKKYRFDKYTQILSWEDIFDLFMPIHVDNGHKGREFLMNMVGSEYKYPSMCLSFFKRICNVCNGTENITLPIISKESMVYVINMVQTRANEQFRYLLIYADKATNFVVLRPLVAKTDQEISLELLKIFTQFGPPKKLYMHGYNSSLTTKIHENLQDLCPDFNVEIEHRPVSYELPTIVTDRIQEWLKTSNSKVWEVGCHIVQRQMNNDSNLRPEGHELLDTPYSLFFHKLSSSVKYCNKKRATDIPQTSADESASYEQTEKAKRSKTNENNTHFINTLTFKEKTRYQSELYLRDSNNETNEGNQEPEIEQVNISDSESDKAENQIITFDELGVQEDDNISLQNDEIIIP